MNHIHNDQSVEVSTDVINFLRLQALLPALGVTRMDHCLHFGAPKSLFVRLMRDSGFSYYQLLKDQDASVSSWPNLRPGLKLLTCFDMTLLTTDPSDSL